MTPDRFAAIEAAAAARRAAAMTRLAPGADPLAAARAAAIKSAALIERPGIDPLQAAMGLVRVGGPRCAARYAHLWSCSIEDAALEFGVGIGAALRQWSELYPGESPPRGGR